jgi:predicted permease
MLKRLLTRLTGLFRGSAIDRDMDTEMGLHVEMLAEEYGRAGMSADEARRAALRRFGNPTQLQERGRDIRGAGLLEELRRDLQYGYRMLRRNPGYTAVALIGLALGIGVNTAIFSFADALLFRPSFGNHGETIVRLYGLRDNSNRLDSFSYPNYKDLRDQASSFAAIAAHQNVVVGVGIGQIQEDAPGEIVTGNYFSVFNVMPRAGRMLTAEDDNASTPIVVVSEQFWRSKLGSADLAGLRLDVNGHRFDVIGVTPASFKGAFGAFATDMWFPLSTMQMVRPRELNLTMRGWGWLHGTGRLKPGVPLADALGEVQRISAQLVRDYPRNGPNFTLVPAGNLPDDMRSDVSKVLLAFMCAAAAVLLITCANIASMSMARTTARGREVAIRQSLGAGKLRLIRQWITESVLLASVGGGAGILLAVWLKQAMLRLAPPEWSNFAPNLSVDWRLLLFALGLAVFTGVLFGVAPALHAGRVSVAGALKSDAAATFGIRRSNFYRVMVAVQVALSLVLLVCSGLLFRSLRESEAFHLGFDGEKLVVAGFDLNRNGYNRPAQRAFYEQFMAKLGSAPAVAGVTHAMVTPLGYGRESGGYQIEGVQPPEGKQFFSLANDIVGPDYFRTMGIPIIEGRDFDPLLAANSPKEAIVNENFVRQFFPMQSAIGKLIRTDNVTEIRIVGVARNISYYSLGEKPQPYVYLSAQQFPPAGVAVFVRSATAAQSVIPTVKEAVRAIDPNVSTNNIVTFAELRRGPLFQTRLLMTVSAVFGVLALILTLIGLYGVISYSVSRRTREFGIRIALGAHRAEVFRMVVSEGLRLTILGMILGILAALVCARFIAEQLFGVSPADPVTFAAIAGLMTGTAALACYIPARRATRVDPLTALREDG